MKINKKLHSLLALVIQAICLIAVIMIMNSCEPIGGQAVPRQICPDAVHTEKGLLGIGGQRVPIGYVLNASTQQNSGNVSELHS